MPFLFKLKGSGSEFGAGLKHAIERGVVFEARERHVCENDATQRRPADPQILVALPKAWAVRSRPRLVSEPLADFLSF